MSDNGSLYVKLGDKAREQIAGARGEVLTIYVGGCPISFHLADHNQPSAADLLEGQGKRRIHAFLSKPDLDSSRTVEVGIKPYDGAITEYQKLVIER